MLMHRPPYPMSPHRNQEPMDSASEYGMARSMRPWYVGRRFGRNRNRMAPAVRGGKSTLQWANMGTHRMGCPSISAGTKAGEAGQR